MIRVALYARYSTDHQRAASIDDQLRLCREFAVRQAWTVTADFQDAAQSGTSLTRPGFQSLVRAAMEGHFDIVLAESLDRFSRDQEHTAGIFKRLTFAGVRIVTVSEGDIGHLHIGLKGTMNALYLHELAQKTRRGLRGRVEAGKSGGGLSYGYRVVRSASGERGDLEIDIEEADVVRRLCHAYVDGVSPKGIAKRLNAEGIMGPGGRAWSPSTIHGHRRRGTGILNNELYVGRRVWNRLHYVKDPDTGRRISRINPPSEWVVSDVPHLRIVDDELWKAVKTRQAETRNLIVQSGVLMRARRPRHLFSGLTTCGSCGGGFVLTGKGTLACFNARDRGTCTNRRTIKREDLEDRVMRAMQKRLFDPEAYTEFCAGFSEEWARLRREHQARLAKAPREIAAVKRRAREILDLMLQGFRSEEWKAELEQLDERRARLEAILASRKLDLPKQFPQPQLAAMFQSSASEFAAALQREGSMRDHARAEIREIVEKIVIPPGNALLQLIGRPEKMLSVARGEQRATDGIDGCGGGI